MRFQAVGPSFGSDQDLLKNTERGKEEGEPRVRKREVSQSRVCAGATPPRFLITRGEVAVRWDLGGTQHAKARRRPNAAGRQNSFLALRASAEKSKSRRKHPTRYRKVVTGGPKHLKFSDFKLGHPDQVMEGRTYSSSLRLDHHRKGGPPPRTTQGSSSSARPPING